MCGGSVRQCARLGQASRGVCIGCAGQITSPVEMHAVVSI